MDTGKAMEIVDGEDLADCLSRGPIGVEQALGFARQIANALAAAHTNGVIHRALVRAGERENGFATPVEAKEKQERLAEIGEDDDVSAWNLAAIHAALGDRDAALQQAYDYGFRFARWPPVDPAFDSLRDDARYLQIVARMQEHVAKMKNRVLLEEQQAGIR